MEKIKTVVFGVVLLVALVALLATPVSAGYNCELTGDVITHPNGCLEYTMGCLPDWFPTWYTGGYTFYYGGYVCPPTPIVSPAWIA